MAALQRSTVSIRRQGSSGIVWDDKFILGDDGNVEMRGHLHHQLRPCQSVRETPSVIESPTRCPRSLSTPAAAMAAKMFPDSFQNVSGKPPIESKSSKPEKKKPWSLSAKKT